jgi:hypothetical protein
MDAQFSLEHIAKVLDGKIVNNSDGTRSVSAWAPGHSSIDDSLSVTIGHNGEIIVNSFCR